jgi:aryl-alcohol dehydrogenase-like predicted oxidoreductase
MVEPRAADAGTVSIGELSAVRLGLGTNRIKDDAGSRAVLRRAVALGINFLDTAALYGSSERVIGQTLGKESPQTIVATKGGWGPDNSSRKLQNEIDHSLEALRLEQLPLFFLHRVDTRMPLAETMWVLREQQRVGKIRYVGLSEVTVAQIETARAVVPVAAVQNRYHIGDRTYEEVVDYCTRERIAFLPFCPLGRGSVADAPALRAVGAKHRTSPLIVALAWLLDRSPVVLPIPGTGSIMHLEQNLGAATLDLDDEDRRALDGVASA